jgi:hypothetical protein
MDDNEQNSQYKNTSDRSTKYKYLNHLTANKYFVQVTTSCTPFQGLKPLLGILDLGFGEDIGLGLLNRCLSKSPNPWLLTRLDTRIISGYNNGVRNQFTYKIIINY